MEVWRLAILAGGGWRREEREDGEWGVEAEVHNMQGRSVEVGVVLPGEMRIWMEEGTREGGMLTGGEVE